MEAKQTPLIDLLESVPRDAVLVVEHDQFSSSFRPVGRLCHEAAAALRAVSAEVEKLRAEAVKLRNLRADAAHADALREALSRILENEASDYKAAEEFGGYVLYDELREEARAALDLEERK